MDFEFYCETKIINKIYKKVQIMLNGANAKDYKKMVTNPKGGGMQGRWA